ncbi:MAG: hypothetical protein E7321_07975 [Clostridiales bacterium]|nr:hypothetical protein [Clostridiales bacterium]
MECGKLTAKLRDAVPVCLMVDGKEVKRYKNIEIPDEIKRLPFVDFKFDVPTNGAITFKIYFAPGVLPEEWPEVRQRQSRRKPVQLPEPTPEQKEAIMAEVEAALMAGLERADAEGQPVHEVAEMIARGVEITAELKENELIITAEESDTMEIRFGYTGEQRKELVKTISEFTDQSPVYQNAPTFAYRIGEYKVDKRGTLTGPNDQALRKWLKDSGFEAE